MMDSKNYRREGKYFISQILISLSSRQVRENCHYSEKRPECNEMIRFIQNGDGNEYFCLDSHSQRFTVSLQCSLHHYRHDHPPTTPLKACWRQSRVTHHCFHHLSGFALLNGKLGGIASTITLAIHQSHCRLVACRRRSRKQNFGNWRLIDCLECHSLPRPVSS